MSDLKSQTGLHAEIIDGVLVISIGVETLAFAINEGELLKHEGNQVSKIVDPAKFAEKLVDILNEPGNDEVSYSRTADFLEEMAEITLHFGDGADEYLTEVEP